MPERIHLKIEGIVQGVGFRPFLHRLAKAHALSGWCRNTVFGVELEVQGQRENLDAFCADLTAQAPPLSRISGVQVTPCPAVTGERDFTIRSSGAAGRGETLISPDIATCPDCLRELFTPTDRRYRHPFINCTNCGPRFTIVRALPYDRSSTAMAPFPMCPACEREYHHIENRRYHAQPNCCPACGPRLGFFTHEGERSGDPITLAQQMLREGKIVAIKGLGGYHLACRADLPDTVAQLRRRKRRDERPFALMCRDLQAVKQLCVLSPEEEARLGSPRAPIVLLKKRPDCPDNLSETRELGIMLPYTPIHHLLMEAFSTLVMTSMNVSDRPVVCEIAGESWKNLADGLLTHDREIVNRCDDSLLRVFRGQELFLRRSRGYAPEPVAVGRDCTGILACGAEQKGSFALGRGSNAFLSQHIGDLKDFETQQFYTRQIQRFQRDFGIGAQRLVCDLHPDYLSTQYAQKRAEAEHLPLLQVQHHHAHMAACMADNGLTGECIGIIWDGTGYGTDGTIWGAECLTGGYEGFTRLGSIRPISLPGGDKCATEIGRIAHSLLWDCGLTEYSHHPQAAQLTRMLEADLNCPHSSGMGRLFDGAYALLSGRQSVTYDGQGAVLLEAMAAEGEGGSYPLRFYEQQGRLTLDTRALVSALCRDNQSPSLRAARLMNSLVELAVAHAEFAREQTGLCRVVLSGGVFQNSYLLPRVLDALTGAGFTPYHHRQVSPNDQGIALGQMMIAAHI